MVRPVRRMVKEKLLKFEGVPCSRRASTVPYTLSTPRRDLYRAGTAYVREEC